MRAILRALLLLVICSQAWALSLADLTQQVKGNPWAQLQEKGAGK